MTTTMMMIIIRIIIIIIIINIIIISGIPPGKSCESYGQCVVNAECSSPKGGLCQCSSGYYQEGDKCLPLKVMCVCIGCVWRISVCGIGTDCERIFILLFQPPDAVCAGNYQCVEHANCTENHMKVLVCKCNPAFYPLTDYCARRKPPGKPCFGLSQCIENAECTTEAGGLCACNLGYYPTPGGLCEKRTGIGRPCTPQDVCAENAVCSDDTGGVCKCETDFYLVSGRCVVRKPVGEACKDSGQCKQKSACNKQTKICECLEGYYAENGICNPRTYIYHPIFWVVGICTFVICFTHLED